MSLREELAQRLKGKLVLVGVGVVKGGVVGVADGGAVGVGVCGARVGVTVAMPRVAWIGGAAVAVWTACKLMSRALLALSIPGMP
jgi:hypothetical protein